MWEPTHVRGAPCMNYVTLLKQDTGLDDTPEWPVAPELRLGEVSELFSGLFRMFPSINTACV